MTKNYLIIAGFAAVIAIAVFMFQTGSTERVLVDAVVENEQYSLSFNYWEGNDGYELITSGTSDRFLQSYVVVEKAELAEFQNSDIETAPPTISVFVFNLPDEAGEATGGRISRLQSWAQQNAGLTSYGAIYGTPKIVELDGVKALEYTTDGIYQQTVYLASYRGLIFMFVGQYDRPTDFIKADFETLIQSVRFD